MTRIKGISVLLLETPLTRSKYIFPTHTHTHTTSYANIGNLLHIRVQTNPSSHPTARVNHTSDQQLTLPPKSVIQTCQLRQPGDYLKDNRSSKCYHLALTVIARRKRPQRTIKNCQKDNNRHFPTRAWNRHFLNTAWNRHFLTRAQDRDFSIRA